MLTSTVFWLSGITLFFSSVFANEAKKNEVFEASGLMRAETRWLVNSLERLHFSETTLEDLEMGEVIEAYMEALDYNHLYFTESDLNQFRSRFAPPMGRYLRSGNLHPAFQIFSVFRERVFSRILWARDYMDRDFQFDEGLVYHTDREEASWPKSEKMADRIWETRIQYELLNEVIAKMDPVEPESGNAAEEFIEEDLELGDVVESTEPMTFEEALAEAKKVVTKRYERLETEMDRFEAGEVQEIFLTTLARTYDPHSIFLSADSLEDLSIAIVNSLVGIGAVLSDEDGYCTVRELIPGGPAGLSGMIDVNDQILGVAQGKKGEYVDVVDMKLRKIVKMIRGEKESIVRLKIRPGDASDPSARKEVVLVRDEVQLTANLARARVYQVPVDGETVSIGVIDLPSFYGSDEPNQPNSSDDVAELISKLEVQNIQGLILDLRGNGGGLLSEAVELAGLFIPEGPVVQVKSVQGGIRHHDDRDGKVFWDGPLVVLVSKFTASASEIVAGALQNYGRALVVGDKSTHGKGTVQGIFRMTPPLFYSLSSNSDNYGATKVTVQKYYLPNGESTQLEGVKSDLVIPSVNDFLPIGEADLDHSLVWDTIQPLTFGIGADPEFGSLTMIDDSMIQSLREQSKLRMETLEEFTLLEDSIDFFRERKDRTNISLNLEDRRLQQKEDESLRILFRERRENLGGSFSYPFERIVLDTETEKEDNEKVAEDETEDPPLDIVLREGIRIMGDWLSSLPKSEENTESDLAQSGV